MASKKLSLADILEQLYAGGPSRPGRNIVHMESGFNVIDVNLCTLPGCQCGWNIQIGGKNPEDLDRLVCFLQDPRGNRP